MKRTAIHHGRHYSRSITIGGKKMLAIRKVERIEHTTEFEDGAVVFYSVVAGPRPRFATNGVAKVTLGAFASWAKAEVEPA